MNRLERTFERCIDRLLGGDWERRIRRLSLLTLLAILLCGGLLFRASRMHVRIHDPETGILIDRSLVEILFDKDSNHTNF